jgi:hypothetical protein
VAKDLVPQDRQQYLQIEEGFTIDKVQLTTVLKTKCPRFKSREIFSKYLLFLYVQLLPRICKVLVLK